MCCPQARVEVKGLDENGKPATDVHEFVPAEVLGEEAGYAPEPRWGALREMPFMEFYQARSPLLACFACLFCFLLIWCCGPLKGRLPAPACCVHVPPAACCWGQRWG